MNLIELNDESPRVYILYVMATVLRHAMREGVSQGEARSMWEQAGYSAKEWAAYSPVWKPLMFKKSSYSNSQGACVEVDMDWRTPSFSLSQGNCVECATFRKASHSNGTNCIETGSFRKSQHSNSGGCIEVGHGQAIIAVRDTKQKDIGYPDILQFTGNTWGKFIRSIKEGGVTWG